MTPEGNRSGSARVTRRRLLASTAAAVAVVAGLSAAPGAAADPPERPGEVIRLHPDNPHYFEFRGRPTVLVSSAEHYGAVLNLDFDYEIYLRTLARGKLNFTRLFTGSYVEPNMLTRFGNKNTLGPAPGRLLAPWARSGTPGYANGGNKFDLNTWDPAYFARLRDFVAQAGRRGIVVEVTLFSNYYNEPNWGTSPLKATNNINGVGNVGVNEAYTFADPGLLAAQEAMTTKIVSELQDFDNVIFEILNEPSTNSVRWTWAEPWQERIAEVIGETEAGLPPEQRHLIAQNILAGGAQTPEQWTVVDPNPAVSLFNFHYSTPEVVRANYGLSKAIGLDETGHTGPTDTPYRIQGWRFMLAGGALYNNLDFSFTIDSPEGQEPIGPGSNTGGGPVIRDQLRVLKDFIERLDFINMIPDRSVITGALPSDVRAEALVRDGQDYAIYLDDGGGGNRGGGGESPNIDRQFPVTVRLPAGHYHAEWLNPTTGDVTRRENLHHEGGEVTFDSPTFRQDIVLHITRQGPRPR
ncbi:MAG: cellulase family glycosylhydrolase [Micromonosporaceae bacterium]